MPNVRVTAFIVSKLLWESQQQQTTFEFIVSKCIKQRKCSAQQLILHDFALKIVLLVSFKVSKN